MKSPDDAVSPCTGGKQWSPELSKLSVRCALAKQEWDELIHTGRKTLTTRRELSIKWDVEYSVLCRKLRRGDHRRIRRSEAYPRPDSSTRWSPIGGGAAPVLLPSSPGPEVLSYLLSGTSGAVHPPPPRIPAPPTATPVLQLCALLNARLPQPIIPRNSAMRRVRERHLENDRAGWTAVSGDTASLLSASEEEAIRKWFRFRLEVADLVTVYDMVDAANSAILISTKGQPLDEGDDRPRVLLSTLRYATTRWAREFMLLRPDLFWSTVKPRVFDIKERPVPDTHCFIEWFLGASGPEQKVLEPQRPLPSEYLEHATAS